MTDHELLTKARLYCDERGHVTDEGAKPSPDEIAALADLVLRLDGDPVREQYRQSPAFVCAMAQGAARRERARVQWHADAARRIEEVKAEHAAAEAKRLADRARRERQRAEDFAAGLKRIEQHQRDRAEADASLVAFRMAMNRPRGRS